MGNLQVPVPAKILFLTKKGKLVAFVENFQKSKNAKKIRLYKPNITLQSLSLLE